MRKPLIVLAVCASLVAIAVPSSAAPRATEARAARTAQGPRLPGPVPCPGCYAPALRTSWQWQLQGPIDTSVDVEMFDVDGFEVTGATVDDLHALGSSVVCYLSAGSWEEWRPDAGRFPDSVIGNDYAGWPGEKWLDIRQIDLLAPILRARLDQCQTWPARL